MVVTDTADTLEEQLNEVERYQDETVNRNTKENYLAANTNFLVWLMKNKRNLVTDEFVSALPDEYENLSAKQQKKYIKQLLNARKQDAVKPAKLEEFTGDEICMFINSLMVGKTKRIGV